MTFHFQKQIPNGMTTNAYGMTEIRGVSTDTEGLPKTVGKIYPWIHWRVKLFIMFNVSIHNVCISKIKQVNTVE